MLVLNGMQMWVPWQRVKESPRITIKTTAVPEPKVNPVVLDFTLMRVQQVQLNSSCDKMAEAAYMGKYLHS